jgi:acetyl-CoA carboxylase carboxyltransferase component
VHDSRRVLIAPLAGTVVSIAAPVGARVRAGEPVVVLESMKMEHAVTAEAAGVVAVLSVAVGDAVSAGQALAQLAPVASTDDLEPTATAPTAMAGAPPPPALQEVLERHAARTDEQRPAAVAKRHEQGRRTARENLAALCDPGSFLEIGGLVVAAQRSRRAMQELIAETPADGLIAGTATIAGRPVLVLSYDYTVLAGTQGLWNHAKKDRVFELAKRQRLPVVLFAEGGGGRPGDTDALGVTGLDCLAFLRFAELSGGAPLIGIASGRCFAGNAALLGCCDVIIATPDANIGMGGPAMIEGGGLGAFTPEQIGPIDVQARNGVVDVVARDEVDAVALARRYLSYFDAAARPWTTGDPTRLRTAIPAERMRGYDIRAVLALLVDDDSVLELRSGFGVGIVTALARVEGRPLGVLANNPLHLGGAIDAGAADKAARFLQLCDAHDLPVLSLCDTPGFMVGPAAEATAMVRHVSRMFVVGANLTVPLCTIVLRKGYGLGAQAMAGGSLKAPLFTVAWPTAELGAMGLEGAVKLGFRRELAAIADPQERRASYDARVAAAYQQGKALNVAAHFELDDVIDPAESRRWITRALASAPPPAPRAGKKRPNIDTW